MQRELRQYAVVTVLLAIAGFVHGDLMWNQIRVLLHPDEFPAAPFSLTVASRTVAGGRFSGDQILALESRPLNAAKEVPEAVAASRPVPRPVTRSTPSTMTGAVPMVTRVASGTEVSETAVK